MRNEPLPVDRVAVKPAAQVIVHSAGCHCFQGVRHHLERFLITGSSILAQQVIEYNRAWKLGRGTEAAKLAVERAAQRIVAGMKKFPTEFARFGRRGDIVQQLLSNAITRRNNLVVAFPPGARNVGQYVGKTRAAVARIRRKVSAAEEWLAIGRQPYRHGPTPAARTRLNEQHVDAIDI